jgi:hypothetical protein
MVQGLPVTAEALHYAIEAGWVICEGGHSVCLTDEGRILVAGVGSDD